MSATESTLCASCPRFTGRATVRRTDPAIPCRGHFHPECFVFIDDLQTKSSYNAIYGDGRMDGQMKEGGKRVV